METKPCKNCGNEIFQQATRCPYCGKNLRLAVGPVILIALAAGVGAITTHDLLAPGNTWVLHRLRKAGTQEGAISSGEAVKGVWHSSEPEEEQPAHSPAAPPVGKRAESPVTKMSPPAVPKVEKPAVLPKGFVPPRVGQQVRVVLVNGTVFEGKLRAVSKDGVEIEKGESTMSLPRKQLAGESRIRFFAEDYALYQSRRSALAEEDARRAAAPRTKNTTEMPTGGTPSMTPPPTVQGDKDAATIFFEAFSK